jgi:regulatory helix-turn-helix LysR family protein
MPRASRSTARRC